jgi:hypothetical protein
MAEFRHIPCPVSEGADLLVAVFMGCVAPPPLLRRARVGANMHPPILNPPEFQVCVSAR